MKKSIALFCSLVLLVLTGCGAQSAGQAAGSTSGGDDGKLQVVSTIFPGYDFARAVCGDDADVTLLLPPGAESHSYEPTPQDILTIQNCDLFIYVGGDSDAWVDTILKSIDQPVNTLKMMDCVNTLPEETVEGMENGEEEGTPAGTVEYDEHVWTAPANAILITQEIGDELQALDPNNADTLKANTDAYVQQLTTLDQDYKDFFATVSNKTIVFGDRFPLRYFAEEYGLTYYAAFPGCSTQTEPSAATVAFLTDKVKEEKISTVYYIEFSNHLVADSIAEATGAGTALFDSCHNVSQQEMDSGATYVSIMRQDLEMLKQTMK